jgi:hypothetical protein
VDEKEGALHSVMNIRMSASDGLSSGPGANCDIRPKVKSDELNLRVLLG